MKNKYAVNILLFLGISVAHAATITWTGAGDGVSLFQEANWDAAGGTLTGDYVPKDPGTTPHDLIINIPGNVGGNNGWGGTLNLGGSGSLTVDGSADYFRMNTSGLAAMANGTAYFKAGNGNFDFQGTWDNMAVTIGSGIDTAGTLHLINGTTVDAQWCAYNSTVLNSASTLKVRGNGNVFAWGKINLIDADSIIVFTGGKSVTDVVDQHLSGDLGDTGSSSAGRILINGLGAVQGFNVDVFTDAQSGCTTVQHRTEPPGPTYTSDGPNIIYIICDDLGYGDLGVLFQNSRADGQPKHATPQLDHMAAQGMQLHSHYCAAPVCAPSRSSLLSGVHQGHSDVRDNQFDKALANNHSLAGMLSTAGYKTAAFGKWGLQGNGTAPYWEAHPLNRGFDYFYGYMRHGDGHRHYPKEDGKEVYENYNQVNAGLDKCYTTDLFTARAKKWITDHLASEDADKPMFLYLAYDTPHAVLQYPSTAYPTGGGLTGGVQWLGTAGSMINTATGTVDGYVHPEYASATYDHDNNPGTAEIAWPDIAKRWAGGVRRVDDAVGDLLTLLDDLNMATNTLVVFTSDNGVTRESYLADAFEPGFFDSFGPFDGIKRDTWEGGIRMPALTYWPGTIPGNSVSTTPSAFWDWMPTFAELAGQPAPAVTDGVSLVPELTGTGPRKDSTIYVEYYEGGTTPAYSEFEPEHQGRRRNQMQVIQLEGYKGVRYNITSHSDHFEIYDVINDPKETTDLSSNPQFAGLQQRMKDRVLQLRRPNSTAGRPYDSENIPPSAPIATYTNGLVEYALFEGAWPWLPDFATLSPSATGTVAGVDLSIKPTTNQYGILYSGYLDIQTAGDYTFYLASDHGANLRIHDALVIDDYFLHTGAEVSGTIKLAPGKHPFRLSYRHDGESETLAFQYEGPSIAKQTVPLAVYALPSGPAAPLLSGKLLDDPSWTVDPIGLGDGGVLNRWHWDSPGIQWETTAANTDASDQFNAGPVTLSNRADIIIHPEYAADQTRLTGIVTRWEASDFTYASTASYDPEHVIKAWYTIAINTGSETFTATSGMGNLHDGPTRLPDGGNGMLQANLAGAWNNLSWDVDPFIDGGLPLSEIDFIDVDFHADTTAPNTNATGSAWFTMKNSGLDYSIDIRSQYDAWAEASGLTDGPNGDDDFDRLNNLTEFACNLNPASNDVQVLIPGTGTNGLPFWQGPNRTDALQVEFIRRKYVPGLTYSVLFTDNLLSNWTEAVLAETVEPVNAAWERVKVSDHVPTDTATNRFGKVTVSQH